LLKASGVAMLTIADQLRRLGVAPVVEAGFLNFSQPTFAEAVASAVQQGASRIIVLPYFLVPGYYVANELPALVRMVAADYPHLSFTVAEGLGAHPALVKLALKRLLAVDPAPDQRSGLLFTAHGTPIEAANLPIQQAIRQVQAQRGYGAAVIGYLECNEPSIPLGFAQLVDAGMERITVLPYFLHLGRHLRQDLPALFAAAHQQHPDIKLRIAQHLAFDPLLVDAVADRVLENS
jgi:precorrin-8X/cobalt-precorrin-8 methylmutase